MLWRSRARIALVIGTATLVVGLLPSLTARQMIRAQEDEEPEVEEPPLVLLNEEVIKRATVFVMQTFEEQGTTVISCVGSGTIVSADGLILTNAHIVLPSDTCRSDRLVIAVTVRLDEPPIPTYTAEIVDASRGLDLAMLRIDGYLDGRAIDRGDLQLPFAELGDSGAVNLDDTITVVGYADLGNAPVSVTRGTVSGFTAEARAGDRAWIRTEATIPGTMSGAGAYGRDGRLIGVPTIAPARAGGETVDCRVLQDTNQDGRADANDHCVPVGGFITALRPSRLARTLVRAAALGIRQGTTYVDSEEVPPAEGDPRFSRPFFTTRINEGGVPVSVVSSVPANTASLYLFFDYDNMVDGMVYEVRATRDNVLDLDYSLPQVTWSGGRSGTWYIGRSGLPWRNGSYLFRLFIEGREVASASIVVGGSPPDTPVFSDIVFGLLDDGGNLVGTNYVLPEGRAVQARFNYRNMAPGVTWSYIWYFGRDEIFRGTEAWDMEVRGTQGTHIINAAAEFLPGQYRLALYINNVLSATADFVVAGGAEVNRSVIFTDFQFSDQRWGTLAERGDRTEFPAGIQELFVFFDWRLLSPGTMWTRRWLVDGEVLFEVTEPWIAPVDGENFYLSLEGIDTLPDGTYGFEISVASIRRTMVSAAVGLGQLPVGTFASAEGVEMSGRITDVETGEGIPGAMFIVLEPEFSVEDFLWDRSQVLGASVADSDGRFQVATLLPRGTLDEPLLYSVLVRAEGYLPVSADGIAVIEDTDSPVEINVELSRN